MKIALTSLASLALSVTAAYSAEAGSYCPRLAQASAAECKTSAGTDKDALKLCPEQQKQTQKSCYNQLSQIRANINFLNFMNSEKYSPVGDKIIAQLEETELTEDALNRMIAENDLRKDVYTELSRLPCVDLAKSQNCPISEPLDSETVNVYTLSMGEYLVAAYSVTGSQPYNNFYNLYLVREGKVYALGGLYEVLADPSKKIVLSYIRGSSAADYGDISFYRIDAGKRKLVLQKSFKTNFDENTGTYVSEDGMSDSPSGFILRALDYIKKMKYNIDFQKTLMEGEGG